MLGKSARWWFGKNSIFGQIIRQTKYGANGFGGGSYPQGYPSSSSSEADLLKYGILFGLFFLLAKK